MKKLRSQIIKGVKTWFKEFIATILEKYITFFDKANMFITSHLLIIQNIKIICFVKKIMFFLKVLKIDGLKFSACLAMILKSVISIFFYFNVTSQYKAYSI